MAKPQRIYLIRHGESEGNVNWTIYKTVPDWKLHLTDKGRKQVQSSAEKIASEINRSSSVYIYSSPWYRTRETSDIVKSTFQNHNYREDPRIREQEWGNYQEQYLADKIDREREKFGKFFYRMPYGESGADVYDRVSSFMDTLWRDFEKKYYPQTVIIVSHGLTIRVFLMRWLHWSVEEYESLRNPKNAAVIKLELEDKIVHSSSGRKYLLKTPLSKRAILS